MQEVAEERSCRAARTKRKKLLTGDVQSANCKARPQFIPRDALTCLTPASLHSFRLHPDLDIPKKKKSSKKKTKKLTIFFLTLTHNPAPITMAIHSQGLGSYFT